MSRRFPDLRYPRDEWSAGEVVGVSVFVVAAIAIIAVFAFVIGTAMPG